MRSLLRTSSTPYGMIIAVLCLVLAAFSVTVASRAEAATQMPTPGKRLITIHDNGQDKAILTEAPTLREAFKESGIRIDKNDMVEPGLDDTLVASSYEVNIYRARPVTIVDGAIRQRVMSAYRTASQIVEHAGMTLHDEDRTTMGISSNIASDGAAIELTIDRATPFTLVLYGKKMQAYTQGVTVADMLKEKGITLGAPDRLSVAKDTPIKAGMSVELWRNGKQTFTQDEDVAFDVEKIQDADHEVGYKEIKTPGVKGKRTVTYEIEMKNGKEVSRKVIQSVVITKPQVQVEIVGAKNNYSGSLQEWLLALRTCETHGNYQANTGNGYYGAYQFSASTWNRLGTGYAYAYQAPPSVQDQAIIDNTNASHGGLATQNPGCMSSLGLSAFPPQ